MGRRPGLYILVCLGGALLSSWSQAEGWRLAGLALPGLGPTEEEVVEGEIPFDVIDNLPPGTYVDLDAYLEGEPAVNSLPSVPWSLQVLPDGFIYKSYLAGAKESRLGTTLFHAQHDDMLWDASLGGRFGLLRIGSSNPFLPEGVQLDVEGAAHVRLNADAHLDLRSADFRAGLPLTFGLGRRQWKLAYYHLSAHVGDEFLLQNPNFRRVNYVRDALALGCSHYLTERLRTYVEAAWAFNADVAKPWEFQVGIDYAPLLPTGLRGAPFFAINGHLREEVNYGGNLAVQAGWAWRSDSNGRLLRLGLHYLNGESTQFAFYDEHEELLGFGLWLD